MHVIAFINRPFASNPAVVCLLDTNRQPEQTSIQHAAARQPCNGFSRAVALPHHPASNTSAARCVVLINHIRV